jgi:alpha-L-fucosidase
MYNLNIPIEDYEKLFSSFNPVNFDADFITDLALETGMKYINLTSCHHEGFCLWNSKTESYNSYAACKRDLVRELAEQCDRKGLGFFLYYTYVLNWRHPYAFPRNILEQGRPDYKNEKRYKLKSSDDIKIYWDYVFSCLTELLELEYPIAGIWLDIIMAYYQIPELIPIKETYKLIRQKRPEALISFKQGATGEEDFAAPEHSFNSLAKVLEHKGYPNGASLAEKTWQINKDKHNEICTTLQNENWGYNKNSSHKTSTEIFSELLYAFNNNCNLLVNTGPLPDGSIHHADINTLKELGVKIRTEGFSTKEGIVIPKSWTVPDDANTAKAF